MSETLFKDNLLDSTKKPKLTQQKPKVTIHQQHKGTIINKHKKLKPDLVAYILQLVVGKEIRTDSHRSWDRN